MQIHIQAIHFNAGETLIKETTDKLTTLEKLYDRIERCTVMLKKENNDEQMNYTAEVRLAIPGTDLFASEKAGSFEQAIDHVTGDLKKQLIKHKEKIQGFKKPSNRQH